MEGNWKNRNSYKTFSEDDYLHFGKQSVAMRRLNQAVSNGTIKKKDICQTCGRKAKLVAHHWKGYDYPFDVWWVCRKCNANLTVHDGSIDLEHAKALLNTIHLRKLFSRQYESVFTCSVCGTHRNIGRFMFNDGDNGEFICQHCLQDMIDFDIKDKIYLAGCDKCKKLTLHKFKGYTLICIECKENIVEPLAELPSYILPATAQGMV